MSPENSTARMIRGARVSPNGKTVVFQALGVLWIQELGDLKSRRLTQQNTHFEFDPEWSRDGKSVVYATWDDERLGAIRTVSARGGKGRILTKDKGHYREPVYTPDGRSIVFRRLGGGWLRSPLWSQDTGLYQLDLATKALTWISETGRSPHFGDNARYLFYTGYGGGKSQLKEMDLVTREHRVVAESAMGSGFRISANGKWLATIEEHNVHVRALIRTGRTVSLGPKASDIPQKQVSKNAGISVHFHGDSVAWTLGPHVYSVAMDTVFDTSEGGFEVGSVVPKTIHVEVPKDSPQGTAALVNVRIITMRGDEVIEQGTVVWRGDRIVAVGPTDQVDVPTGAHVIDGRGMTVLPGLVDVHFHGSQGTDGIIPEQNWANLSALSFGVTTVHDPSNNTEMIFSAKELQRTGRILGPRIFQRVPSYTVQRHPELRQRSIV